MAHLHVFPARAGMSPIREALRAVDVSVPRASGDEPHGGGLYRLDHSCSPRERG